MTSTPRTTDAEFAKYADDGAYHWREASSSLRWHQAFTVERYRRTLTAAGDIEGKTVLDYGCGDGALLGWIADRVGLGGKAHGFDPNPEAQRLAQHMLDRHSKRATVHTHTPDFDDGHFDTVISAEVVEHVHDVPGYFEEIHRLLKPGGTFVLTTPIRMTEEPEDPNHVVEWFPTEFRAMLEESPFEITEVQQFIPAAAPELYFWRPRWGLRLPVMRVLCNAVSIAFGRNVLTDLQLRPRLFMTQLAVLRKS